MNINEQYVLVSKNNDDAEEIRHADELLGVIIILKRLSAKSAHGLKSLQHGERVPTFVM